MQKFDDCKVVVAVVVVVVVLSEQKSGRRQFFGVARPWSDYSKVESRKKIRPSYFSNSGVFGLDNFLSPKLHTVMGVPP